MTFKINLFPTELLVGFDTPVPLLKDLDTSGRRCAKHFDDVLNAANVSPATPHDANSETLRQASAAFTAAVHDDETVPVAVSRTLARNMPRAWDRIVRDARNGELSGAVMLLEAASRTATDQDDSPASPHKHPVTAYLDETGSQAAEKAFAAYDAAIKGDGDKQAAHQAAQNALIGELAKEVSQDAVRWIRELDPQGFRIVMATAAAGVLASFLAAPRTLLENASTLGLHEVPIGHEFHVARIHGQVQVKLGLQITALTGELAKVESWNQIFSTGLAADASLSLDFGDSQLIARARISPGQWGLHFGFSRALG